MAEIKTLVGMSSDDIKEYIGSFGEKSFRGKQIADWIYRKSALKFTEMTNLPRSLIEKLKETAVIHTGRIKDIRKSKDGTAKYLISLNEGGSIESVILPYDSRVSVCISTQVGCAMGCKFCATGLDGVKRNLSAAEIVDQVLLLQRETSHRISHVVYMGMGEPLANYDNVLKSIHILNDEIGISMRRITLSTVGIIPRIRMLAKEDLPITLAISLHAPNDDLRRTLIPIASKYPLDDLVSTCKEYQQATGRRLTFEYLLIKGVNDSLSSAHELARLLRGLIANVNLIPYNRVEGLPYQKPDRGRIGSFRAVLESEGLSVTQRMEKGQSVDGACGQLRLRDEINIQ